MQNRGTWVRTRRWLQGRLREVAAKDLLLLGRTLGWLVVAKVALQVLPVRWIIGWQRRKMRGEGSRGDVATVCARVRWAVLVVARRSPVGFVCFPQCLAAGALLRGYGVGSLLHYGVRRGETGALETHTWLEAGGEALIGGEVAGLFSELEVY